jgi:hypothetical protein
MLVAQKQVVQPKVAQSARQVLLRALPPPERHSMDVLRDVRPATVPVRQAVQPPARGQQSARSRASVPSRAWQSQLELASHRSRQAPLEPEHSALARPSYRRP